MAGPLGRRARTLEEIGINMTALLESAPLDQYRPLETRPGDIYLTSWPKCGTTLMQQMFHQIRMLAATGKADMDFDDITRVTPWEDTAPTLDLDMNLPQRAAPRGFKSHRPHNRLPADARFVVTLRDPKESYVSYFRDVDGWHFEEGALGIEEFLPLWLLGGPAGCDYFTHLLSWYARRDEPDTLLADYREAARDRAAMVDRLAAFMGVKLAPDQAALVVEMTSRDYMYAHRDRFDDAMLCRVMEERIGVPFSSDSTKVQAIGSEAGDVPEAIAAQIDAIWAERVLPATGHADFASLAASLSQGQCANAAEAR